MPTNIVGLAGRSNFQPVQAAYSAPLDPRVPCIQGFLSPRNIRTTSMRIARMTFLSLTAAPVGWIISHYHYQL
jgi:hypothetical protein